MKYAILETNQLVGGPVAVAAGRLACHLPTSLLSFSSFLSSIYLFFSSSFTPPLYLSLSPPAARLPPGAIAGHCRPRVARDHCSPLPVTLSLILPCSLSHLISLSTSFTPLLDPTTH